MKKSLITLLVIILAAPVFSQVKSARLQASGLTCAMCARAVYKGLESLPFVDKIDTDLNESAFLISFKEGKEIDIDAIKNKVEGAGCLCGGSFGNFCPGARKATSARDAWAFVMRSRALTLGMSWGVELAHG